jgi:hypothetical protein
MKRHVLWKNSEMSGIHTLFAADICVCVVDLVRIMECSMTV